MVKTKSGIYISYDVGFGANYAMPCTVFQRGAAVIRVGVSEAPYGYDMRIKSADREGLLREIGPVISRPKMLMTSLDIVAGMLDCPHHEPLHYHHDGCPAGCDDVELLEGYDTELKSNEVAT